MRTADGAAVITSNGQVTQVTSLSRDWAPATVDVAEPAAVDVSRVSDLLQLIGERSFKEPELRSLLLAAVTAGRPRDTDTRQPEVRRR